VQQDAAGTLLRSNLDDNGQHVKEVPVVANIRWPARQWRSATSSPLFLTVMAAMTEL
jgi:hypothetical protein